MCARYWCLVAGSFIAEMASPGLAPWSVRGHRALPVHAIESLVRGWEAAVQARVGDLEALGVTFTRGSLRRGPRTCRYALKLRLTFIDGLINADKMGRARGLRPYPRISLLDSPAAEAARGSRLARGRPWRARPHAGPISAHESNASFTQQCQQRH